jgi:hypothetical protein
MAMPMPPPIAATSTYKGRAGGADTIAGAPSAMMAPLAKKGQTQAAANATFNAAQAKMPAAPVAPTATPMPFGRQGGAFGMRSFNNQAGPWGAMTKAPGMTGSSPWFGNFNGGFRRGGSQ